MRKSIESKKSGLPPATPRARGTALALLLAAWGCASGQLDERRDRSPGAVAMEAARPAGPGPALGPVYGPLADFLVRRFDLAASRGIGIDVGGGRGALVVELCRRAPSMHWIHSDIDPGPFPSFFRAVKEAGAAGRASAMRADACSMPFRNDLADIIVSRGSFFLWADLPAAFAEIRRVLKPGAVAFIGRGFSENLPVETARAVRAAQKKGGWEPGYKLDETEAELRRALEKAGIEEYEILRPAPPGSAGISYGIWVEFRKPRVR